MSSKKGNPSPRQRHRGSARADEVIEEARVGTQDSVMGHGGGQHEALFAEHRYEEGVSDLLIACQTDTPNSYRLINRPITKSCMRSVLEKQIVRRTNRLIRVRKLMCLLSIFCVFVCPTVCYSASTCRS